MDKSNLTDIPDNPGVYKFKDSSGNVLYVGKAKSIKKRVSSYFTQNNNSNPRLPLLLKKSDNLEYIVTGNEVEALILENNLIKQFKPKFNVRLRDDKQYPYLKITDREKYPRLLMARKIKNDGASYYGPYTSVLTVKEVTKVVMKIFAVCTCRKKFTSDMKPCLNYQMKLCSAPCAGLIDRDEYLEVVEDIKLFLEGRIKHLLEVLNEKMVETSNNMLYEKAAFYRDGIESIKTLSEIQKASIRNEKDKDCIVLRSVDGENIFLVLTVRDGKIINQKHYIIKNSFEIESKESIEAFIKQYYTAIPNIPSEILTEKPIDDANNISQWLSSAKKKKVKFLSPKRGKKTRILSMASINADYVMDNHLKKTEAWKNIIREIKDKLGMKFLPDCIDAVDISNLSGSQSVGAVIRWQDGQFARGMYRKYSIKWKEGIDDFLMIEEAVTRHLARIVKDRQRLPSLILIDGGKGQVGHALKAVKGNSAYGNIFLIGITKGRKYSCKKSSVPEDGYSPEEIVFHDRISPLRLRKESSMLFLLQSIRDEAHRFAIQYHRKLRNKKTRESILDSVKGIGNKRKMHLLRTFGSIKAMSGLSAEEISSRGGISIKAAEEVINAVRKNSS